MGGQSPKLQEGVVKSEALVIDRKKKRRE